MSTQKSKSTSGPKFTPEFKAKVVLGLVRSDYTLAEAGAKFSVGETALSRWKQEFLERAPMLFSSGIDPSAIDKIEALEQIIGQQTVELTILKKASGLLQSRKGSGS